MTLDNYDNFFTLLKNDNTITSKIIYLSDKYFILQSTVLCPESSFRSFSKGSATSNGKEIFINTVTKENNAILHFYQCLFDLQKNDEITLVKDIGNEKLIEDNLAVVRLLHRQFDSIKEYFASADYIRISTYEDISNDVLSFLLQNNIPSYIYRTHRDGKRIDIYMHVYQKALSLLFANNAKIFQIKQDLNVDIDEIYNVVQNNKNKNYIKELQKRYDRVVTKLVSTICLNSSQEHILFLDFLSVSDLLNMSDILIKYEKNAFITTSTGIWCFFINEHTKHIVDNLLQQNNYTYTVDVVRKCILYNLSAVTFKKRQYMIKYFSDTIVRKINGN